jgi:hypothetical protein
MVEQGEEVLHVAVGAWREYCMKQPGHVQWSGVQVR